MIIGHIGARKGSKGVPGKNFKDICGHPLIYWSLQQLIDNDQIDKVVVSTDDKDIYEYCLEKGALDIGLRPKELSGDSVSKWDVWQHSFQLVENIVGIGKITAFLDLDCTSPLRNPLDIDKAINLYFQKDPDIVISCCEARKNPYFNLLELDNNGYLNVSKKLSGNIVSRQQAPIVLEHAASTYVIKPSYLKTATFLYDGNAIPLIIDQTTCIDIDTDLDFEIVEIMMKRKMHNEFR